ncbi:V-type ATP synthase subunit A [candidate division KSB3 bacterium]|uniref:V-type ATP synthase alpha chain n=1 Tax=candidate division KSB3 bacterium TaxID=2044937 RepID=A0A9D5JYJ2_9BACT|nr:V-type ATP synthase subunit A [candidate division KSB3 bacterium]MBD3326627.1 V-type ATP synthase subunit A [candidate division KSB3 bacterium]
MKEGKIIKVSGPLVIADGMQGVEMYEVVRVGKENLIGEVIELRGTTASIQVYEATEGLGPGDPVYPTGSPLVVELGPGLIGAIYDGIQRPLNVIQEQVGDYITRGVQANGIVRDVKWHFVPTVEVGAAVEPGDVIGEVQETPIIVHRILVPHGISGTIASIQEGEFTVEETVAEVTTDDEQPVKITMLSKWEVRKGRPYKKKLPPDRPLTTGQRNVDTFFPIAKGGTACIPGPFGSGKTVVQHQFAKWADAKVVIYIGCGERGNEMTDVLDEFPELIDPQTGRPLMERTVLIANTSNMPVAAREASVYTGITLAEYYRDMGYDVALMADSTSRWAEAMREISGRLEEMPGEEGYPAYLASRLASFYERAGRILCLGQEEKEATLSVIGAVSPPGGDLSEPVAQNTMRIVKVFWGLDANLAYQRHFPAINWLNSYSLYVDQVSGYIEEQVEGNWLERRNEAMKLLNENEELQEIVSLVGAEALTAEQQLTLRMARTLIENYLMQDAFDDVDSYCSREKQFTLLSMILDFNRGARDRLHRGEDLDEILRSDYLEFIGKVRFMPPEEMDTIRQTWREIQEDWLIE